MNRICSKAGAFFLLAAFFTAALPAALADQAAEDAADDKALEADFKKQADDFKKANPGSEYAIELRGADLRSFRSERAKCARAAKAGPDTAQSCFDKAELENAKTASKEFEAAYREMNSASRYVLDVNCHNKPTVSAARECALSYTIAMRKDAEDLSNPALNKKDDFAVWSKDPENANSWALAFFKKECEKNLTFECFEKLMGKVKGELRQAEGHLAKQFGQILKNHALMYSCSRVTASGKDKSDGAAFCANAKPWSEYLSKEGAKSIPYAPASAAGVAGGKGTGKKGTSTADKKVAGKDQANTGDGSGTGPAVNGAGGQGHLPTGPNEGAGGPKTPVTPEVKGAKKKSHPDAAMDPDGAECKDGDCIGASKIDITDHSGLPGEALYQCPSFLNGFNCLSVGDGNEGDLAKKGKEYQVRENFCREKLVEWLKFTVIRGDSTAAERSRAVKILEKKQPSASATSSPACEMYFKDIVHYTDPHTGAPAIPSLATPEDINLARVSSDGALHDLLMYTADALTRDVEKEVGIFSVQQQAKFIFTNAALQDPSLLTDDAKFGATLKTLLGNDSGTQCLGPNDRKSLELGIRAERETLKDGIAAVKKEDPSTDLNKNWVDQMTKAAARDHQLEKGEYVLGMMEARLYCIERNNVTIGQDLIVDLHEDFDQDRTQGTVDEATYKARLAWFDTKYLELTGEKTGASDGKVNCRRLHEMLREMHRQREENISSHPLLADIKPLPDSKGNMQKAAVAIAESETPAVKCVAEKTEAYGEVDKAAGFESKRSDHPHVNSCARKKTLSDRVLSAANAAQRGALLKEAAERKRQDALKRLKEICGPGNDDLAKEGKRGTHVDGIAKDFLACTDVGTTSPTCEQRRSMGWVLCRSYAQKYDDDRLQELKDFYKQMAMTIVTTAAMMVPGGGLVMRIVNLAIIGGGFAMEYHDKVRAEDNLKVSTVDFNNQQISYAQYKQALASKEAISDNFWAWQAVNVVFAGLEAKGIRDAIKEYRAGKAVAALSIFEDEARASKALESSEAMGANKWTGEDTFNYLKKMEAAKGGEYVGLADEYLGGVKASLQGPYGAGVNMMHESADVLALERFESHMRELERTNAALAKKLRAEAAEYLAAGACKI